MCSRHQASMEEYGTTPQLNLEYLPNKTRSLIFICNWYSGTVFLHQRVRVYIFSHYQYGPCTDEGPGATKFRNKKEQWYNPLSVELSWALLQPTGRLYNIFLSLLHEKQQQNTIDFVK